MNKERPTPPLKVKATRIRDIGTAIFVDILLEDGNGKLWDAPTASAFRFDLKPHKSTPEQP